MLAQEILKIPLTQPEILFKVPDDVDSLYKQLAKEWHPDRNSNSSANEVFQHLNVLHDLARKKVKDGVWETPGLLILYSVDGKSRREIKYKSKKTFALGEIYTSKNIVTYCVTKDNKDLYDNFLNKMKFKFIDDRMKTEASKYLPEVFKTGETRDRFTIFMKKDPTLILASDLLTHYKGFLPPAHVCWVLSSLYNVAAYLQVSKLCHGDISLDSYYLSPKSHSGVLMGGWWYSETFDKSLVALPQRTVSLTSAKLLAAKKPCAKIDLECIKMIGRELLNDPSGMKIDKDDKIAKDLSGWLKYPSGDDALKEYRNWTLTLEKAYGKRRFTEMPVKFDDVYV